MRPQLEDLRAAASRISGHVRRTPVLMLRSGGLAEVAGAPLALKCENLQRVGAFKYRGACNAVFGLDAATAAHGVVTHSSGNHGAALALAARERGIPATVVMPRGANRFKRAAVERYGAEVVECEPSLSGREAAVSALVSERCLHRIPPFDDARIIAGQGTCALELLEQAPGLSSLLVPLGGGGLLAGTLIAVRALRPQVRVIGVEPSAADDALRSLRSGERVTIDAPQTVADGLKASIGELNLAIVRDLVDDIVTVDDPDILAAMRLLWERAKLVVEPSAAVGLAALTSGVVDADGGETGIIITGGNVDLSALPWDLKEQGPG